MQTGSHHNQLSLPHRTMVAIKLHTHPFNGTLSGTTRMSRYQKGTTNLDFNEARDSEWQWHQLGHMQICTLLQTNNHASIPPLKFFTGQMPFLLPNQPCQSTEGILKTYTINTKWGLQVRVHFPQIQVMVLHQDHSSKSRPRPSSAI